MGKIFSIPRFVCDMYPVLLESVMWKVQCEFKLRKIVSFELGSGMKKDVILGNLTSSFL